ncbi:MAG: anti-sigma F factor [Epulopiscium sp. Nele67-Bin005]|nr:MAG: anti-sigma F factor [Epulopiscium sp. Nele67-Bin005]
MYQNKMNIQFTSHSENEAFARATVSAFLAQLDPTIDQLYDIKMAVSEAVTNAIIHGYESDPTKQVHLMCEYKLEETQPPNIIIEITDFGQGIVNIDEARTALFTTAGDADRAGLGFTVMESVVDNVEVFSELGKGTTVTLQKQLF